MLDAVPTVEALDADGPAHEAAVFRLRVFLVAVGWFELDRRRRQLALPPAETARLVAESAEAACASVLSRLGEYRGQSRFALWAAKFAIHETAAAVRRSARREGKNAAARDTNDRMEIGTSQGGPR